MLEKKNIRGLMGGNSMDLEEKFEKSDFNVMFTMENVYVKVAKTFQGEIVANEFILLKKTNNFSLVLDSPEAVEITMFGVLIKVTKDEGIKHIAELITNGGDLKTPQTVKKKAGGGERREKTTPERFGGRLDTMGKGVAIYKDTVDAIVEEFSSENPRRTIPQIIQEVQKIENTPTANTYGTGYRKYIYREKLLPEDVIENSRLMNLGVSKWNLIKKQNGVPIMSEVLEKVEVLYGDKEKEPQIPEIEEAIYNAYKGRVKRRTANTYAYGYREYIISKRDDLAKTANGSSINPSTHISIKSNAIACDDHQGDGDDLKPLKKKTEREWNAITSVDSTPIIDVILEKLKPLFLEEKNNPGIAKIESVIYEAYNGSITKSRATEYAYNYLAYIKKELRKEDPEKGVYKNLPDEFWHRSVK